MKRFDLFDGALGLSLATMHNGMVWVSGMVGVGADFVSVPETMREQMDNTFANIGTILQACESSIDNIVDVTMFYVGDSAPPSEAWSAIGPELFPSGLPSLTMVGVERLNEPQHLIEIKVVAAMTN